MLSETSESLQLSFINQTCQLLCFDVLKPLTVYKRTKLKQTLRPYRATGQDQSKGHTGSNHGEATTLTNGRTMEMPSSQNQRMAGKFKFFSVHCGLAQ